MRKYTCDLYSRLEAETGQSTGFNPVGFIELATEPDRLEEYRRVSAFNRYCGVDVHEISAKEVAELFPLAKTDDVLAGFYVKEDGRPIPSTSRWRWPRERASRARPSSRGVSATGVLRSAATAASSPACEPTTATSSAEFVVNCAGMWARQLGDIAGVNIPLAGRRALLPHHRADRGALQHLAGDRGPCQLRLLPRGGRRADGRPVRVGVRAVERCRAFPTTSRSA